MAKNMLPWNEQTRTLDPEDASLLEKYGAIGPVTKGRRLFSERAIASISASSPVSPNVDTDPHAVLIPDRWQSPEYLECLGFDTEIAKIVWRCWSRWHDYSDDLSVDPPMLADFAKRVIGSNEVDAFILNDNWHTVMKIFGVSEELQAQIKDPKFEAVRLTEGAKHCVMVAMQGRQQNMDIIYARSRDRIERRLRRRLEEPLSSAGYTAEDVNETEDRKEVLRLGPDEDQNIVVLGHGDARLHQEQEMSQQKTRWTSLWRPMMNCLCKEDHYLDCLPTYSHTDFRGDACGNPPLYLFASKDLATTYARYMASRISGGSASARLLRIDVPACLIESLNPFHLELDAEYEDLPDTNSFTRVVNASPSGRVQPAGLAASETWSLLIGNICKSNVRAVGQLTRWQDLSEHHLVKHEEAE